MLECVFLWTAVEHQADRAVRAGLLLEPVRARADLLELLVGVAPAEALGDGAPARVALEVAPVRAEVGQAVARDRVDRRHDRHVLGALRRVGADPRGSVLAHPGERPL